MKITLINPPSAVVEDDRLEPNLGLLYIAATILENGYNNVTIYDMAGCSDLKDINIKISNIPISNIYGISCFSTNYIFVKKIIKHLRKQIIDSYIIVGGPHPTALPEHSIDDLEADAIVCGEGEDEFLKLVKSYQKQKKETGIFWGLGRYNIDTYSFPAHHLVDYSTYSRKLMGKPVIAIITSRGCKYKCIHCNSIVMGGGNKKVRYRSTNNIVTEIKEYQEKFHCYRFCDDHFTGNPNLFDLLHHLRDLNINFRIFSRIEDLKEETCKALKLAGCKHIAIGLESLIPENLKILGKGTQIGLEENIRNVKKYGIIARASFMVGLPFDNEKRIIDSFKKAKELAIDEFAIYPLIPYPGTSIAKYPDRYGYEITELNYTKYVQMGINGKTCFALKHRNFTPSDVKRWLEIGTEILSKKSIHMRHSKIA